MKPEEFKQYLADRGVELTDQKVTQFQQYFKFLVETNEHVNLTAITAEEDVYLKHFLDSILPLLELPAAFVQNARVIDIGAGAGFPSLPIKILRPDLTVTIVDSLNKRIKFLGDLVIMLSLDNVELVHGRAEDVGQDRRYREKYDLVTARAVARLNTLSEYCLPFAKVGGAFVALKGPRGESELQDSATAIAKLGGKLRTNQVVTLPETAEQRMLTVIDKVKATPKKYPAKQGCLTRNHYKQVAPQAGKALSTYEGNKA